MLSSDSFYPFNLSMDLSDYFTLLRLHVGRGGALVDSMLFDLRVVGSIPALAAT